jgi:hypothetical protein
VESLDSFSTLSIELRAALVAPRHAQNCRPDDASPPGVGNFCKARGIALGTPAWPRFTLLVLIIIPSPSASWTFIFIFILIASGSSPSWPFLLVIFVPAPFPTRLFIFIFIVIAFVAQFLPSLRIVLNLCLHRFLARGQLIRFVIDHFESWCFWYFDDLATSRLWAFHSLA